MPEMDGFALAEQIQQRPGAGRGHGADAVLRRPAGGRGALPASWASRAYLIKPVKQSELLDAILTAPGRLAAHGAPARRRRPEPARRPARGRCTSCWPRTTRSTRSWPSRLLEKQGHTVVVADNGREALDGAGAAAVRPGADGRADAGDGRPRGDGRDPPPGAGRPAGTCRSSP